MSPVPPSHHHVLSYGFLALPLSFAGLPLYVHAPDFYMRDLGLDIGVAGAILLIIRLFDAVQDPIIGYVSDKSAGRRFQVITLGVIVLSVGMMGVCYGPPTFFTPAPWFACSMVLATTGFSVVTINLTTLGGLWCADSVQRTRISGWREAFSLIGLLVASVLPPVLQIYQTVEEAFRLLFWVFGALMLVGFFLFARFMQQAAPKSTVIRACTGRGLSFIPILMGPNCSFFGICFLSHLAAALPSVTVLFFVRDYLQSGNLSGLFLFLYFISGAAFMVVWMKLAARIGKESTWLAATCLAVVTFMWAYFLMPGHVVPYAVICVLSGITLGADLALPPSMLADRITQQKSEQTATQHYAVLALLPKMALALASGFSLLILDQLSFVAGGENTPGALRGLITVYALVPCLIKLGAGVCLWRFNQGREAQA